MPSKFDPAVKESGVTSRCRRLGLASAPGDTRAEPGASCPIGLLGFLLLIADLPRLQDRQVRRCRQTPDRAMTGSPLHYLWLCCLRTARSPRPLPSGAADGACDERALQDRV
jgi:hypothetical protein